MNMNQENNADSSAPIGCSAAEGPQLTVNPARSADDILKYMLEFAEIERSHANRQWIRAIKGEMYTKPDYYTGRHDGMTIVIGELQRILKEKATQPVVPDDH
jgi:hypothetical protein